MKINLEFPYNDYIGYLVTNPENRKNICLVHKINKKRTTISYARYLMSVQEKRILNSNEHVDHKDEDKTNDIIDNLQILTLSENNFKNRKVRGITRKYVKLICPNCLLEFEKVHNQTHLCKGGKFTSCSKTCLKSILTKKLKNEDLINLGKNQIIDIFSK